MEIAVDHRTPSLAAPPPRSGGVRRRRTPPGQPGQRDAAQDAALRDVLERLGERVRPVAFAKERTLPVAAPYERLLPDGLVRGHVMSCRGTAARSLAFGLVRDAMVAGGWMAVVDVPTLGADAMAEFGVPLERIVRVDTGVDNSAERERHWVDVMGAAIDGFDLVLTRVPSGLRDGRRPAAVRKLGSRLQQKGAIVLTLGASGALGGDIELRTQRTVWEGLEAGSGHLRRRTIDVEAGGRRLPGRRTCSIELVGVGSRLELVSVAPTDATADRDPQAELLAEMVGTVEAAGMVESAEPIEVVDIGAPDDRQLAG